MKNPDCYKCVHRGTIPGDARSRCAHPKRDELKVTGHLAGIQGGWFRWPNNFDPTWLQKCNGFERKEAS